MPLQRKFVERVDLEADEHFAKFNQLVKFVKESAMRTNLFFGHVLADVEPNKKLRQQNTSKEFQGFLCASDTRSVCGKANHCLPRLLR